MTPSIYDAVQSGMQDGRETARRQTLARYAQPALSGDQGALSKIYGADPDAGMKVQQNARAMQQQGLTDQDAAMARLGRHARMVASAAQSGDMQMAQQLYS